jgi:hypothetical protein
MQNQILPYKKTKFETFPDISIKIKVEIFHGPALAHEEELFFAEGDQAHVIVRNKLITAILRIMKGNQRRTSMVLGLPKSTVNDLLMKRKKFHEEILAL